MSDPEGRRRPPGPLGALPLDLPPERLALAAELRRGREQAGVNLQDLAQSLYSSKASISRWLSGRSLPTRVQAGEWAELCGTDLAIMLKLWDQANAPADPSEADSTKNEAPPDDAEITTEQAGRRLPRRTWLVAAAALVLLAGALAVAIPVAGRCRADHPVALYVPAMSGRNMGITAKANCHFSQKRIYILIEELPDVDPKNPHSVYFAKVQLPALKTDEATAHQLLLEEPVGTKAKFYVISVDAGGARAMEQNKVVDQGLLQLPTGTRQESDIIWHLKQWK